MTGYQKEQQVTCNQPLDRKAEDRMVSVSRDNKATGR